ncbi:MAG: signal peptidase I, partial [Planktothrix sp.]
LLDGLDELGEERAKEAIRAIDALQADYHHQQKALVICCRVKDYESIADNNNRRICLKGVERAVRLCKLADEQIERYLKQRKAEHIWDEIQSNSGLMKLARNPMLLNLMPIAYPDELPDNLPYNSQDCQSRLFDDFLHRKLYPPHSSTPQPLADYDPKKAKYYLAWLAASMGRKDINQREFLIEKLQPNWLENKQQKNQYLLIRRLIFGLIINLVYALFLGLIFAPSVNLIVGLSVNLIVGLILAFIFALIFGLILEFSVDLIIGPIFNNFDSIDLTESFDISWKNFKKAIFFVLCISVVFGLIFGLIVGLFFGRVKGLIFGLIFGLNFVLVAGLIERLKTDIKIRKYPNQGIWQTGLKSLITMWISIFICHFILIVPRWEIGENWNLTESLILGVLLGILSGYCFGGGDAFTKHFILRWVLCHHGRIPCNYVHFLNEANACGILKQSGGRYRFYHDKFREHLASTIQLKVEPVSPRKKINFFGWSLQEIGIVFTAILLAVILTNTFGFNPDSVSAMNPLIQTTDRVFFDRLTYPRWRQPQRYQVISFATKNLEENFSKHFASRRILALPDERLEISSGQIILNGKPFDDNRIKLPPDFNQSLITLAADEYYVVADNLDYDNFETFGAVVPRHKIRGQLVLRVYPFDRVGLIR